MLLEVKNKGKSILKVASRDLSIYSHATSPWMRGIRACQKEIAELNPHPHYTQAYRSQEIFFWRRIPEWIRKDYIHTTARRYLDIGCAFGTLALYSKKFLKCDIYTTDYVDTYLSKTLAKKYDFFFRINNIELDAFPWDAKFDVITFTEVLEHLNFNPVPTLRKIRSLLTENGKLYLSTPDAAEWGKVTKYYADWNNMPLPNKSLPIVNDHVYQYTKEELFDALKAAGFNVERFGYSPGVVCRHFNLTLT